MMTIDWYPGEKRVEDARLLWRTKKLKEREESEGVKVKD